eukprot:754754-Hanusia_phi.AAC.2
MNSELRLGLSLKNSSSFDPGPRLNTVRCHDTIIVILLSRAPGRPLPVTGTADSGPAAVTAE